MAQKPLSTLFEEKLSQREFEMKDAYWQDAEELIIQSNKKKRRKWFLYFFIGFLFLGTSLYSVFYYSNNNPVKNTKTSYQTKQEKVLQTLENTVPKNPKQKTKTLTIQDARPEMVAKDEQTKEPRAQILTGSKENLKDSDPTTINSSLPIINPEDNEQKEEILTVQDASPEIVAKNEQTKEPRSQILTDEKANLRDPEPTTINSSLPIINPEDNEQKEEILTLQDARPEIVAKNKQTKEPRSQILTDEKENLRDLEPTTINSSLPSPAPEQTRQNPIAPVLISQKENSDPNLHITEETPDEASVPLKEQMLTEINNVKKETAIPIIPVSEEEPAEELLIAGDKSTEEQSVLETTENMPLEGDNIDETTIDASANNNDSYIKQDETTIPADNDLDYTIEAGSIIRKNKESGLSDTSSSDGSKDDPRPLVSEKPSDSNIVATIIKDSLMDSSKASPFSLGLYGGLSSVQKLLTSQEENLGSHIAMRKAEEQPILTFSAGMELNYQPNRWLVSTGIYYNEYGEKINYSPNVYEQEQISSSGFWTIATFTYDSSDSLGNPIIVTLRDSNFNEVLTTDTITITDKSITEQNGNTKLAYIEIPVLVGYEFSLNNMSILTRTGVSVGYLLNSKGYYVAQDNAQLQDIGTKEDLVRSFSINYLLKAGIHYPMGEMATIFVEPRFKINLQSILGKSNNVSQKYYTYGVNLGIKYKF